MCLAQHGSYSSWGHHICQNPTAMFLSHLKVAAVAPEMVAKIVQQGMMHL